MIVQNGEYKFDPLRATPQVLCPRSPPPSLAGSPYFLDIPPLPLVPPGVLKRECCSPVFWVATCCSQPQPRVPSAQGPSAHGRVSARRLSLSTDPGTLHLCWQGKVTPSRVPLFLYPTRAFPFVLSPSEATGWVGSESGVGWPLAATPAGLSGLFLTRRVSSPQGAPIRGPSFLRRLLRFQFHVLGIPESQAEAEHVLESHRMFDDLWNVPALSVTRRTTVVGSEEALRCSRWWGVTARYSGLLAPPNQKNRSTHKERPRRENPRSKAAPISTHPRPLCLLSITTAFEFFLGCALNLPSRRSK